MVERNQTFIAGNIACSDDEYLDATAPKGRELRGAAQDRAANLVRTGFVSKLVILVDTW